MNGWLLWVHDQILLFWYHWVKPALAFALLWNLWILAWANRRRAPRPRVAEERFCFVRYPVWPTIVLESIAAALLPFLLQLLSRRDLVDAFVLEPVAFVYSFVIAIGSSLWPIALQTSPQTGLARRGIWQAQLGWIPWSVVSRVSWIRTPRLQGNLHTKTGVFSLHVPSDMQPRMAQFIDEQLAAARATAAPQSQ